MLSRKFKKSFLIFLFLNLKFGSSFYLLAEKLQKEEEKKLPKIEEHVVVTASKVPMVKSEVARSILVIEKEEIKSLPVSTVEELLKYVAGLDLKQRGAFGLQADLSLRGGTFEQTLVLIDGIKMSDPQTGHNTLHLPLTLEDIDFIEVLKGPGSRLFGPNAFSGIVNIVTRKSNKKSFNFGLKVGEHNYQEIKANVSWVACSLKNNLSFSSRKSNGYFYNTDFNQTTGFYRGQYEFPSGRIGLQAGLSAKAFGANGFYSANFPDQWEKMQVLFVAVDSDFVAPKIIIKPRFYWRYGSDEFLLDRNHPSFYRNLHYSHSLGGEITASFFSLLGQTTAGLEWRLEKLDSTRLGDHLRSFSGFFLEQQKNWPWLNVLAGVVVYNYPGFGLKFWPGFEANFRYSRKLSQFFSYNRSFRLPSFTELYYYDPANRGNDRLEPEEAWEIETGWRYRDRLIEFETSVFSRQAHNLIDWVKITPFEPWMAKNIARIKTIGFDVSVNAGKDLLKNLYLFDSLRINYANYNSKKDNFDYLSKYVFSSLKQQLILTAHFKKMLGLRAVFVFRTLQRFHQPACFLIDGKISWEKEMLEISVEGSNLTDKFYYDAAFIPAPGRWLILGIKFKL